MDITSINLCNPTDFQGRKKPMGIPPFNPLGGQKWLYFFQLSD
jgi:hypothetical protein